MECKNIFQLLGIDNNASPETVKKAFRRFAHIHHPDVMPGNKESEEKFKHVTAAYHHWKLIQNAVQELRQLKNRIHGNNTGHDVRYRHTARSRYTWTA